LLALADRGLELGLATRVTQRGNLALGHAWPGGSGLRKGSPSP
jgi:hypothetical protein